MDSNKSELIRPVLITGAGGHVGSALAAELTRSHHLRLTDRVSPPPESPCSDPFATGDLRDADFAASITAGAKAIVHIAGDPRPDAPWRDLCEANVLATAELLDAALTNGVQKIIYISSVHVSGGYNDPRHWPVSPSWPRRPCCRYGVSKAAGEMIAELYAERRPGASVIILRLPLVATTPRWAGEAAAWLATPDLAALVLDALRSPVRFGVYFATSAAPRPRYDSGPAHDDLGYTATIAADPRAYPATPHRYAPNCLLWHLGE